MSEEILIIVINTICDGYEENEITRHTWKEFREYFCEFYYTSWALRAEYINKTRPIYKKYDNYVLQNTQARRRCPKCNKVIRGLQPAVYQPFGSPYGSYCYECKKLYLGE